MSCGIEAIDQEDALGWGYVLLGDDYKHCIVQTEEAEFYDGIPIPKGEIETDERVLQEMEDNYEVDVDGGIVESVFAGVPLTSAQMRKLNPPQLLHEIKKAVQATEYLLISLTMV